MIRTTLACLLLTIAGALVGAEEERGPPDDFVAVDFGTVDRRIGKQPEYVAEPRYALFLFGPRAAMRVWAVLDKTDAGLDYYDVLYFDRNADGDLTQEDERFVGTWNEKGARAGMGLVLRIGELKVPGTDLVHTDLVVSTVRKEGRTGTWFRMKWNGEHQVSGGSTTRGDSTQWGATPGKAPILRPTVRGRLTFGFYGWGAREVKLTIGESPKVYLVLGNRGSGPDTLCPVDEKYLDLEKDRIHVTLIAMDEAGAELRSEGYVEDHC